MFRQIRINAADVQLQRIVWSPPEDESENHYALSTVTYGESCALYLALRTLKQLCIDEGAAFPETVKAIKDKLYVDDFLSGAEGLEEAGFQRDQLIRLLLKWGFQLKRWVSNNPSLLEDIPAEDRLRPDWLQFATGGPVNELGISWDLLHDAFRFAPPSFDNRPQITKRQVLSEIARQFDPVGWLGPIVIVAKMFMQDL